MTRSVQTILGDEAELPPTPKPPWRMVWLSVAVVVVVIAVGVAGWSMTRGGPDYPAPASAIDDGGLVAAGTGPVTVDVYLDFLCPVCRSFVANANPALSRLIAAEKIRLVWHPVSYLDDRSSPPGYATRAAASVVCAADAGKLAAYGNALLYLQPRIDGPGLSDDQLIDIAGVAGIITPVFARCVRAQTYAPWIQQADRLASQRGISLLPAIYVAGKPLPDPSVANLEAAVAAG